MNTNRPKYIADGFVQDLIDLMADFLKLKSLEFKDFASVWRKHHFSLIFMGRPDDVETSEFVNEMFRLTTQYLEERNFEEQVGGVYVLYGLYRNQISDPPIKIRLERTHFDTVKSLRSVAIEKQYKSLQFVLEYLLDNGFVFVYHQTLRGPLIHSLPSVFDIRICKVRTAYKDPFNEYCVINNIEKLRDMHLEYVEETKKIPGYDASEIAERHKFYENLLEGWNKFVDRIRMIERNSGMGRTTSSLRTQAFQNQSKNKSDTIAEKLANLGSGPPAASKNAVVSVPKPWPVYKEVRPRKEDKRPGRPPKYPRPPTPPPPAKVRDDECDISHLLDQQKELFFPLVRGTFKKNRTKREPYYKSSPKREEDDGDDSSFSEEY